MSRFSKQLIFAVVGLALIAPALAFAGTDAVYWHRGKSVSAVADGATEDTITSATGADTSFKDNDRIVVSDGTGYKVEGFVDGTPSATSLAIDDGAGADPGATEKVGVYPNLSGGSYAGGNGRYFEAGDNYDLGNNALSISFWHKGTATNIASDNYAPFVGKLNYGSHMGEGEYYIFRHTDGRFGFTMRTGETNYTTQLSGATGLAKIFDNKWHHIAILIAPSTNGLIYVDSVQVVADSSDSVYPAYNLDNAKNFAIGSSAGTEAYAVTGGIRDVKIYLGASNWTTDQILYQATRPLDYTASAGTLTDYWRFTDDSSATAIAGNAVNLSLKRGTTTNYGTHSRTQQAFVSKNLIVDGGMENGGIGAYQSGDSASTLAKNTTASLVKYDAQSLKITNADASQAFARQTIATTAGGDYVFRGWFYAPTTPNGASQLVDVDATAALGITVTQAGATVAGTWYEVDFAFEAADTQTTIDLGSGSATNAEIGYWDNVEVMPNLVNNGGLEGTYVDGVAPGWSVSGTPTVAEENTIVHSGSKSQKMTSGSSANILYRDIALQNNKYYTFSFWSYGTGNFQIKSILGSAYYLKQFSFSGNSWARQSVTFKNTWNDALQVSFPHTSQSNFYIDDVSIVELDTLAASTATPSTEANSFNTGKWGESNGAFLVDGGDTLTYPTSGNISASAGTISMWVKPNGWSGADSVTHDLVRIYTNASNYFYIQKHSGNVLRIYTNGGGVGVKTTQYSVNASNFTANSWQHIVVTYTNGGNQILYLNGSSVGTPDTYIALDSLPTNINIGVSDAGTQQADGFFDDVRIYDSVLSPTDVSNLYNNNFNNSITTNQWSHLAGVYSKSGSNLKIYVDGVLKNTYSIGSSYDLGTGSSALTIGDGLTGYLDDVRVYPEARSASQIKADFTGEADPTPKGTAVKSSVTVGQSQDSGEGLAGYWKMDDTDWASTSATVSDSSGNSQHGTPKNGAATSSTAKFGNSCSLDGTDDYIDVGDIDF